MRGGLWRVVVATMVLLGVTAEVGRATSVVVGEPRPLGARALELRMRQNPELESFIALRGYPDWVEEVEVDSGLPLDTHEVRLYYLRLDREVAFTEAYILGRRDIALRLSERPIAPEIRDRIVRAYLARDPARRAELAAARAAAAAEHAERAADAVEDVADNAERFADRIEHAFHRGLRK
jgi:hypothetical protein